VFAIGLCTGPPVAAYNVRRCPGCIKGVLHGEDERENGQGREGKGTGKELTPPKINRTYGLDQFDLLYWSTSPKKTPKSGREYRISIAERAELHSP